MRRDAVALVRDRARGGSDPNGPHPDGPSQVVRSRVLGPRERIPRRVAPELPQWVLPDTGRPRRRAVGVPVSRRRVGRA